VRTARQVTKRKLILTILAGVGTCVVLLLAWLQWRPITYDPNGVLPALRALQEPYTEVYAGVILDGGSIHVRIVDAQGRTFQCSLDVRDDYRTIHIGVSHYSEEGSGETTTSEDTKGFLEKCLRRHDQTIWIRQALVYWRPRPFDYAKFIVLHFTDPAWERQPGYDRMDNT